MTPTPEQVEADNTPHCAHCIMELKHYDHANGTRSDYWRCKDCGINFEMAVTSRILRARVQYLQTVTDELQKVINSRNQEDHSAEVQAVFDDFMFSFRGQDHFPLEHDIKNLTNKLLAAAGVKERVE